MKQIEIDCLRFSTRQDLHETLARYLSFPKWYGNNLDAFHDMLTSIRQDTTLILQHFDKEDPENTGFLLVLEDSVAENRHLHVIFE